MREKVIVIGLDGATFNLIRPWVREGRLPALARLMEEGCYGELISTPDMMSPSAWTSFATGKNPGKHGLYNFLDFVPNTLKLHYYSSIDRDGETLWGLLNKSGKKAGVLNVPMTYPADTLDGFMISGWNAPTVKSKGFSHPPEMIDEILKKFGGYPLFPTVKKYMVENKPSLAIEAIKNSLDAHAKVSKYLMETRDWDLLIAFFIATDQVQHYFWHYMDPQHPLHDPHAATECRDAIFNIYERCDRIISELIEKIGEETTIIVMSDHGHGPNHGATQYLPLWLKKMRFAVENEKSYSVNLLRTMQTAALKSIYNQMNKHLNMRVKGFLNRLVPNLRDKVESTWRFSSYDWARTKVFFHYEPRINLKGREPFGIISHGEEYEQLRNNLIEKLYECRDVKTGQRVIEKVFKGEEVYHGKHVSNAPDIVIWWKEGVVLSGLACLREDGVEVRVTEKYVDDPRTGNHFPHGIFLIKGKHIRKGKEIKGAEIIDLAPTILHLMNSPVPNDIDGKVLTEVFDEDFLKKNPVKFTKGRSDSDKKDGYSKSDEDNVHENLKALGYIE
ncbi:MAG: alkaline phosphatase family protein [Nitrospirae bacterium]|nr:alkaline phosphatase family protein [Nitrospirota bacterium]